MLITRHMLFVGFSLEDDNFHRIVDDVRKALGDRSSDPEPFGTALMVRAPSFTHELWKGDLDVVGLDEAEVGLVLDRVLTMSSTLTEFLMDESFAGFLTPEEAQIEISAHSTPTSALRRIGASSGRPGPASSGVVWKLLGIARGPGRRLGVPTVSELEQPLSQSRLGHKPERGTGGTSDFLDDGTRA